MAFALMVLMEPVFACHADRNLWEIIVNFASLNTIMARAANIIVQRFV